MTFTINGRSFRYVTGFRDDSRLRGSFCALAESVFGIDFETWYRQGNWGGGFNPCALAEGDRIVSNVSVNRMRFLLDGKPVEAVQLGTVMTDPACRHMGLSRFLMERVLSEQAEKSGLLYLFANGSVLDFYPKFGFRRYGETETLLPVKRDPSAPAVRRLDISDPADLALLLECNHTGNPFSRLALRDNDGLLLFYCGGPLRENLFYIEDCRTAAVVEYEGPELRCLELLGPGKDLGRILSALARPETERAVLGFTPRQTPGARERPLEMEDTFLFIRRGGGLLSEKNLRFPELSHT